MGKKALTKQNYDSMTIGEIEDQIDEARDYGMNVVMAIVERLYYLERTGRFRENKEFKSTDFEIYLRDRWDMTPGGYEAQRKAIFKYPNEITELGLGTVVRVTRYCTEPMRVFAEIETAQKKRKTPLPVEAKRKIIDKHKRPSVILAKGRTKVTQAQVDQARDEVKELQRLLNQRDEQIERLKATVLELKPYKEAYRKLLEANNELHTAIAPFIPKGTGKGKQPPTLHS